MTSGSYLLFERGGGLWGIDSGLVLRIGPGRTGQPPGEPGTPGAAAGDPLRIELVGTTGAAGPVVLAADEVEGIVAGLAVRPLSLALRTFWPEAGHGVAVHSGRPVILLDPLHLPPPLVASGGPDA